MKDRREKLIGEKEKERALEREEKEMKE